MIQYHCESCNLEVSSSTCPICGNRTKGASAIYWCPSCNVPIWNETCPVCATTGKYIATDVRPVFPQERLLVEILLGKPMEYQHDSVWFGSGRYIVNGKTVRLPSSVWRTSDPDEVRQQIDQHSMSNQDNSFETFRQRWVKANKTHYEEIVAEAMLAVQNAAKGMTPAEMFVSFSGGKDSTVTSSIATRALGTPSIIHLYGNTTLEFPETLKYVERFKKNNSRTPVLTAQNTEKNFFDMCDVVGPPSRVKRWCCIIFKTGAITRKIERTFPGKRILTFYGIRRNESASRNKYERETESPKISKQIVFSPIIDWLDFDVWLYILLTEIDFNAAYRLGYTRVGCWCCPNNSSWSEFLSKIYMPEQAKAWRQQLIRFAKQVGKPDPEDYVDEGGWKARQGGNGLEVSKRFGISFTPCATAENAFNYDLTRPITEELYELFKPFGKLSFDMGNRRLGEVYVLDRNGDPILKLQGKIGKNTLRVTILKLPFAGCPRLHEAEMKVKCQLSKYQICLGCMACISVCKMDAIHITPEENGYNGYSYKINDAKCIRCEHCVNHFDGGCYMRDVIRTKDGA